MADGEAQVVNMDSRCPLKLNNLPCKACPLGENLFLTILREKHKRKRCHCKLPNIIDFQTLECGDCLLPVTTCHWGINSEQDNYCLWTYLSKEKNQKEITDTELSEFINLTVQRVGQIKNKAMTFLYLLHGHSLEKHLIL